MITGQGIRTAFGTKPLKLPYASGKTLKHFLPPGVHREEAVGSTEWSHERSPCSQLATFHLTSLLKLPLSRRQTQELYHGASKERPAPRTDGNLSNPLWNDRSRVMDPVLEAPQSKRTALHSYSQGLQWMGHTRSGFFTAVPALRENREPLPTVQVLLLTRLLRNLGPQR